MKRFVIYFREFPSLEWEIGLETDSEDKAMAFIEKYNPYFRLQILDNKLHTLDLILKSEELAHPEKLRGE